MPRQRRCRRIQEHAAVRLFKPAGKEGRLLEQIQLPEDELEAIRLVDFLEMDQTQAAAAMQVSQPTLHRLLRSAHKKVAAMLIQGKALTISNGATRCRRPGCRTCPPLH